MIRGLWVTINDSGVYNFKEALNRNKKSEGKIYLYRAIEAMLRLIYVLNDRYYPPTKWLSTGLQQLSNDFQALKMLEQFEESNDLTNLYQFFMNTYNIMQQHMKDNDSMEQESIENYPCIFQKPFYIFHTF